MDSMALEKLYDATPLQVLTSTEMRNQIRALKERTGLSQAAVVREILAIGIPMMAELHGMDLDGME